MKSSFLFIAFIFIFFFANAQVCKKAKVGMTKYTVLELIGPPEIQEISGMGDGTDTLFYWKYGNQQLIFNGDKIETIKTDLKKEKELSVKLANGEIAPEDYFDLLEKINKEGCK